MMGSARILFSLAALSALSLAAEDKKVPEATVTVNAEAQPVEVARTPAPVRILESEELARLGSRTLAELLEVLQPGAVMSSGGPGKSASAFLNGTLSKNVVILLDGLRLNDPTAPSPDLGALSMVGIARVELILGPASVLYGSDAIGGVIALTSVGKGAEGFHGQIGQKVGTEGLGGASAQVQLSGARGWFTVGAEATKEDSAFPQDSFRQAGGFLRLGTKLDMGLGTAELTGFYRNSGQSVSTPFALTDDWSARSYQPNRETRARQESWGASLRWTLAPSLVLEESLQVLSNHMGDPNGPLRQQTDRDFRRVEDQLTLHWTPSTAFRLSGRLEGREDTSHARNYYDPSTWAAVRYRGEGRDLAGALESRWTILEGLDWVLGLRRDAGHRDLTRYDSSARSRAGSAEASTWRTGLNWVLRPELRLYASAGQGFRMPSTTEFTLNAQAEGQDGKAYGILPERSRTFQIGASGLCAGHWEYRIEAQRTRVKDLLAYVSDPAYILTSHYENQGSIRAQSLEMALGYRGGADVAYGWDVILRSQETRDLDHNTEADRFGRQNTAITRHPFFTGAVSGFVQSKAWRADLRFDRIGSRYDLDDITNAVITTRRAHHNLNVGLSHEPTKGLTLALRGEHLLQKKQTVQDWLSGRYDQDGDASLVYGFPAPSPRWTLAAIWRW